MRVPTRAPGIGERRRCRLGAADELRGGHAVARGEDVNVAGLRRIELVKASRIEGGGNSLRKRGHAVAPRSVARRERGDKIAREHPGDARRA